MLFIALDVARFEGESGGVISKMNEGYLLSIERALIQAHRQEIPNWLVKIDLSVVCHLCEHGAGECFCDGSYFKNAIAVLYVHQRIVASLNSDILL